MRLLLLCEFLELEANISMITVMVCVPEQQIWSER